MWKLRTAGDAPEDQSSCKEYGLRPYMPVPEYEPGIPDTRNVNEQTMHPKVVSKVQNRRKLKKHELDLEKCRAREERLMNKLKKFIQDSVDEKIQPIIEKAISFVCKNDNREAELMISNGDPCDAFEKLLNVVCEKKDLSPLRDVFQEFLMHRLFLRGKIARTYPEFMRDNILESVYNICGDSDEMSRMLSNILSEHYRNVSLVPSYVIRSALCFMFRRYPQNDEYFQVYMYDRTRTLILEDSCRNEQFAQAVKSFARAAFHQKAEVICGLILKVVSDDERIRASESNFGVPFVEHMMQISVLWFYIKEGVNITDDDDPNVRQLIKPADDLVSWGSLAVDCCHHTYPQQGT